MQVVGVSEAAILQAAAASAVEEVCDALNLEINAEMEKSGLYARPRFSPGYGDFPLEHQPAFLKALDAAAKIGIHLTDGYLMMPSKSVTALIGFSGEKTACSLEGCEMCHKTDCTYRRTA